MTLTVRLDEELEGKLRKLAAREGESLSEFVRRAVEDRVQRVESKKTPYELGKHLFGRFSSGRSDLSTRSKEIFREKMRAKHARRSR
jgi:predicted DNA-binding protein